jgi:hypothetical protein
VESARANKITLALGLVLITAGLLFLLAQSSEGLAVWMMQLWPVFLILAGLTRIACFAIERKPRYPADGMVLIGIGIFILAGRVNPELNALQVYGRYWIFLLMLFAGVEVVRFYSHRAAYGRQPRMISLWRIAVVLIIIVTGVAANRIGNNRSLIDRLRMRLPISISSAIKIDAKTDSIPSYSAIMNEAGRARQTEVGSPVQFADKARRETTA